MVDFIGIPIPGLKLNSAIPVSPIDSVVPSAGALLYVDPTHPAGGWANGVPQSSIPNLVASQAVKTIGGGGLDGAITIANTIGPGEGLIERTGKGGLHIVSSRTQDVSGHVFQMQMSAALAAWLLANQGHTLYMGMSMRVTRAGIAGVQQYVGRIAENGSKIYAGLLAGTTGDAIYGTPGAVRSSANIPGLVHIDVATNATTALAAVVQWFLTAGPLTSTLVHKAVDFIVYDFYVEDLTVSGRTYTEVNALRVAKHNALHVAGGRYYGDTWTNPALVA